MNKIAIAALALAISLPALGAPGLASAQPDYRWQGAPGRHEWDPSRSYHADRRRHHHDRRLSRSDEIYRGGDGRYYCKRDDGTTGLVIGGIAGGVLGNAIGGDTLSTLIGAAGGAALGRSIDRGDVKCR